jgi:cytochrome c-type biogenesis protein CcmF
VTSSLGYASLILALPFALYALFAAVLARKLAWPALMESARRSVMALSAFMVAASAALLYAFATDDFSVRFVAEHSSRATPFLLKLAAFYSGQEGSLLYWATLLSVFSAVAVWVNRKRLPDLMPYVIATLMAIQVFFLFLLNFVSSPFQRLAFTPNDGAGLNPLLVDMGMLFHPPFLLAGYMSMSVPFAFAMAALIAGRLGSDWIRAARRWMLVGWAILGTGNLMGSWWAYHVLGWGGYWGWDPVENAALMPWLTGSAFVHSIMIQERKGMLKVWNMGLIIVTFLLSVFGTFVVRSGVLTSVHSFAQSAIGPFFFGFLAILAVGSIGLLIFRLPMLRSDRVIESMVSREASFLLQNLLFVGIAFATMWGTVYPLITELLAGVKITVGAPFFQQVNGPLFLAVVLLMGVAPLLPWRKASRSLLLSNFLKPTAAGLATLPLLLVVGIGNIYALVAFPVCVFVFGTIVQEFWRGLAARRRNFGEAMPVAMVRLVGRNQHRYGGYIAHLGVLLIAVAVAGSSFFQIEHQFNLRPGESATIGEYTLVYQGLRQGTIPGARVVEASVVVEQGGTRVATMAPGKRFYQNFENQPSSEIAIRSTPLNDLYLVLVGWQEDGQISMLAFVNPLVFWLWIGGAVMIGGTLISLWPEAEARKAAVRRVADEAMVAEPV